MRDLAGLFIEQQKDFFTQLKESLRKRDKRLERRLTRRLAGAGAKVKREASPAREPSAEQPPAEAPPLEEEEEEEEEEQKQEQEPDEPDEEDDEDEQEQAKFEEDEEYSIQPAFPLTKEEEEFKTVCRCIAGRLNLPLGEIWSYPKRTEPPVAVGIGPAHHLNQPPQPPAVIPRGLPNDLQRFLTNSALSAFEHILFLIRSLNNPAVSNLSYQELMRRHQVMFVSWVSLFIQYELNITAASPLYKTRHAIFALNALLEQHRAYFAQIRS